jgi:hypothetical protein
MSSPLALVQHLHHNIEDNFEQGLHLVVLEPWFGRRSLGIKALDKASILTILAYFNWSNCSHLQKISKNNRILEPAIDYIWPVFLSRLEVNFRPRGYQTSKEMTHGTAKAKTLKITAW